MLEKSPSTPDFSQLADNIKVWGIELGFQQIGISDVNLEHIEENFATWLRKKLHGDMHYMAKHGTKRTRPAELIPGTVRVISARMDYLPTNHNMIQQLQDKQKAYISRYALGRDYHKVLRSRLIKLAKKINDAFSTISYRAFVDSAPVMEKPLTAKAGLGWQGKNTLLINRNAGSWFFLGELYTNLPLPIDTPTSNHCGRCTACMTICPTQAIIAPYQLDARRCISYLTIEYKGVIPEALRPHIGNRIFGCDDCQLICPWNKFAKYTQEKDFQPRHHLQNKTLLELFSWSEADFLKYTEGSALRRVGYECWLRNIAVALGNSQKNPQIICALLNKKDHHSTLVREHVAWALEQQ